MRAAEAKLIKSGRLFLCKGGVCEKKSTVILVASLFLLPSMGAAQSLSFSVVPQQSASKLARLWSPILKYLSEKSGVELQFTTAKNIPTFEKRLAKGEYDFAYMNPYHYTVFSQNPGYLAFARQKDKQIKGIIVVRKDSELSAINQLADQSMAFPSPAAFAATLLPQANLNLQDIPFTPKYVSSHDSVYLNVARGLFPAGGGIVRTFNNTDPKVREQLRILWTTRPYTPHAFAAHPRIRQGEVERVKQALIEMGNDPVGKQLLETIKFKGVQTAGDADWDDVRALNISVL